MPKCDEVVLYEKRLISPHLGWLKCGARGHGIGDICTCYAGRMVGHEVMQQDVLVGPHWLHAKDHQMGGHMVHTVVVVAHSHLVHVLVCKVNKESQESNYSKRRHCCGQRQTLKMNLTV